MSTVVITGGTSGIGHATARLFAARGWDVVIAARSADAVAEVAGEIGGLGVVADVARWEDVDRLASAALARFGRIDVWVNNAAVAEWAYIEDMTPDEMHRVIDVDVLGTMYGVRAVLPVMRRQGGGVIINVASALADRAIPLLSTYSAAKAAVKSFSDSLRMELKETRSNIDVVTVLPSAINTPFYRWGLSRLGVRPHPVSLVYPPEAVAKAIVRAAERPRREVFVGFVGKAISVAERISPRAVDWYMLQRDHMFRQQYTSRPDAGESNLFHSPGETAIDGPFGKEVRRTWIYRAVLLGLLGGFFAWRSARGGTAGEAGPRSR